MFEEGYVAFGVRCDMLRDGRGMLGGRILCVVKCVISRKWNICEMCDMSGGQRVDIWGAM